MGNPTIELNNKKVTVHSFFFNMGMTVFREQYERHRATFSTQSVIPRMAAYIVNKGYEDVADTVFPFDDFVSTEQDRSELIQWFRELKDLVLRPGFELPESWRKLLLENRPPIPITRDHFLRLAYNYQLMLDLIESRIQEERSRKLRPPPDWQP